MSDGEVASGSARSDEVQETTGAIDLGCRTLAGGAVRVVWAGRQGGVSRPPFDSLNVGHGVGDLAWCVERNRALLADTLGLAGPLVSCRQVHATAMCWTEEAGAAGSGTVTADIIAARDAGPVLLMKTADCPAIVLTARSRPLVALVHAGWRGAVAGVIEAALRGLRRQGGVLPGDVEAFVAPAIGRCCFEVGPDLVDRLARRDQAFLTRPGRGRPHLDLVGMVADRLLRAGVPAARLDVLSLCTCCHSSRYFSYRAARRTGRNAVIAWIQ